MYIVHSSWFRLDLSHPRVKLLGSVGGEEDSHEVCSVGRMPELKCLYGFCDREASEPESKTSEFPTDYRRSSPKVLEPIR